MRQARAAAKADRCLLCGKQLTRFCNSHSVPQFALKNIAENGKVIISSIVSGSEAIDINTGINKAGTFQLICDECDNTFFQDYEAPEKLQGNITDKILAEIAIKNFLLYIHRKNIANEFYKIWQRKKHFFLNPEDLYATNEFDINDLTQNMNYHRDIVRNAITGGYQLIHYEILPYIIPLAFQGAMALDKDLDGIEVNDLHYFTDIKTRVQYLHICALPIGEVSCIIMFYHKRDKKYRNLWHQFNCISDTKKIEYINYLVFKYSENYFVSPKIQSEIETNNKLIQLAREENGRPDFGLCIEENSYGKNYIPIAMNEIPNFLSRELALNK